MKFQKSKLLLVVCLVVVFMSVMLTGCGSSDSSSASSDSSSDSSAAAPAAGTKAFEDAKSGIKFNYPEGWKLEESSVEGMIAAYANQDPTNLFTFNLITSKNEANGDFSAYGKQMEEALKSQLDNGKILSNKSVKVAGCDGVKIEYTGEISGLKMKNSTLIFGKDKNMFVLTVAGTESGYDKNAADMKNLEKSISLK